MAHGSDVKNAECFGNVIYSTLINFPNDSLILDANPPMEPHLLRGMVNHLYKNLTSIWPECKTKPDGLYIPLHPFHDGHFHENYCQKLLKNVDIFQQKAGAAAAFAALSFVDTFRKLKRWLQNVLECRLIKITKNTLRISKAHTLLFQQPSHQRSMLCSTMCLSSSLKINKVFACLANRQSHRIFFFNFIFLKLAIRILLALIYKVMVFSCVVSLLLLGYPKSSYCKNIQF